MGGWAPGQHQKTDPGPGLIFIWVIQANSRTSLSLSFPINQMGIISLLS